MSVIKVTKHTINIDLLTLDLLPDIYIGYKHLLANPKFSVVKEKWAT